MSVFRPSALRLALIIAVALFAFLFGGERPPAHAASFTVNSTADAVDANPGDGVCAAASGQCTLRAAIMEANDLSGADTITLPAGVYTLAIPGAGQDDGVAATGDLDITGDVTINGAGAASTIVQGCDNSGGPCTGIDRIFTIWGTVTISRVAIRNGNAGTRSGGGIANWGALEMNESTVTANRSVTNCGGGIYSFGGEGTSATIRSSTISGNSAVCAGGIGNQGQFGVVTIIDSTISDNSATGGAGGGFHNAGSAVITGSTISNNTTTTDGGGIWASPLSGSLILTNSTVSGNSASGEGGGVYVSTNGAFAAGVFSSTVAFNTADSDADGVGGGGGIANAGPAVDLEHTIIGRNADPGSPSAPDCAGELNSQGHIIIQDPTCPVSGSVITGPDPLLGPLADNGGPTMTHALLPGSPAIDAGDNANCTTNDQRGYGRPADGDGNGSAVCDIGAYELGATPVPALKQGDVDCSGTVDSVDALGVLRFVAHLLPAANCIDAGDVDCNNGKDSVDALDILRFVALLTFTPPAGCTPMGQPL